MCDPDLRQRIEEAIEEINRLKDNSPSLPEDWELALELGVDDETGEPICSYYFARLSTRCLFWLHYFDLDSVLAGLSGVTEKTHIREFAHPPNFHKVDCMNRSGIASPVLVGCCRIPAMNSWLTVPRSHWEMFPHDREIPEPLVQELVGILTHAGIGMSEPVSDAM